MKARGALWLDLLPYFLGALALAGAVTWLYQLVDNHWATDAGIAEGKKRMQPKIDALEKFKADTIAAGKKAEQEKQAKEAADKKRKEQADAENKAAVAALSADVVRMRRERDAARRSIVPQAPAGSKCPDGQACFDRAELEREIRGRLDEVRAELRKLVDEGSAVTIDLNTARRWAQP